MTDHGAPVSLPGWHPVYSGKVRDLYLPDDETDTRMLVVASDRVSAFDHVLEPGIPGKGTLLTTGHSTNFVMYSTYSAYQ